MYIVKRNHLLLLYHGRGAEYNVQSINKLLLFLYDLPFFLLIVSFKLKKRWEKRKKCLQFKIT